MDKKLLFTSAAASAVAAPGAFGELLTSDVFEELLPQNAVFIDLDANEFTPSPPAVGTEDIVVFGESGASGSEHDKAVLGPYGDTGAGIFVEDGTVKRFAFGDALTGDIALSITPTERSSDGTGNWGGFTGIAYTGFERNGNLGWIELDYNPGTGGAGSIIVNRFGFANEGEIITAGQIPEPATTASVMALLAGSAVLYARRRKNA